MTRSNIHVLIAHDCLFAAECLSLGLTADPDICVIGLIGGGEEITTALQRTADCVLIHLTSPWPAALRVAAEMNSHLPGAKIILLGVPPGENSIIECIKGGAVGWLPISASLQEVRQILRTINEGYLIYPPRLTNVMFRCLSELAASKPLTEAIAPLTLTSREIQVMELLTEEKSNQEIATLLHLSVHTVKKHVHNILTKLEMTDRAQLLQTTGSSNPDCE